MKYSKKLFISLMIIFAITISYDRFITRDQFPSTNHVNESSPIEKQSDEKVAEKTPLKEVKKKINHPTKNLEVINPGTQVAEIARLVSLGLGCTVMSDVYAETQLQYFQTIALNEISGCRLSELNNSMIIFVTSRQFIRNFINRDALILQQNPQLEVKTFKNLLVFYDRSLADSIAVENLWDFLSQISSVK